MSSFFFSKVIKRKDPKRSFVHLLRASSWPLKMYITLIVAFFLGIALLIFSRASSPLTLPLEKMFLNASGYFFSFFHDIGQEISIFKEAIGHRYTWSEEKKKLEMENLILRQQFITFENVNQENQALRQLLNVVKKPDETFITAPVVSNPVKGLNHTFLIGAGTRQGVRKGQPVLSFFGVVGQVHQVGENFSRVMPLTHRDSRIPVVGTSSRIEAIIAGDGSAIPVLTYLQENKPLTLGELFITSRYGGRFPYGYGVGHVEKDEAGQIRIHPSILWDRLEFVQVITAVAFQTPEDQTLDHIEENP